MGRHFQWQICLHGVQMGRGARRVRFLVGAREVNEVSAGRWEVVCGCFSLRQRGVTDGDPLRTSPRRACRWRCRYDRRPRRGEVLGEETSIRAVEVN